MTRQTHFYRAEDGHGLKHNPFSAMIAPRPIGWISSLSREGQVNLAPYSFFNGFNYTPQIIGFSSLGAKDTVRNIQDTGEFCWNFASQALAEKMNLTSAAVGPDEDEFDLAGIAKGTSRLVKPPHVLESPVVMECRLIEVVQLQTIEKEKLDTYLVLGQVMGTHIRQDCIVDGVFDLDKAQPVVRAGGLADYYKLSEDNKFLMERPKVAR